MLLILFPLLLSSSPPPLLIPLLSSSPPSPPPLLLPLLLSSFPSSPLPPVARTTTLRGQLTGSTITQMKWLPWKCIHSNSSEPSQYLTDQAVSGTHMHVYVHTMCTQKNAHNTIPQYMHTEKQRYTRTHICTNIYTHHTITPLHQSYL